MTWWLPTAFHREGPGYLGCTETGMVGGWQVVVVVDARRPLFYRCPDLEVRERGQASVGACCLTSAAPGLGGRPT